MEHLSRITIRFLTVLLAVIVSCRPPLAPDQDASTKLAACTELATVNVSAGLTPVVSWTPHCGLGAVLVVPIDDGEPTWGVVRRDNQLPSPVTYGTVPSGGQAWGSITPLENGLEYRVILGVAGPLEPGHPVTLITRLWEQAFTP